MEEKFGSYSSKGQLSVEEKETHPAWNTFRKFALQNGLNMLTGTEWLVPWTYFKAGWDLNLNGGKDGREKIPA